MRERQAGAWSSFKKGARLPWDGSQTNKASHSSPSHKGSVSRGLPHFHSSKRVGRDKTKQKCPRKPLPDKILTGLFLSDESVSTDDFKHPESKGTKQFCPPMKDAPAQPFLLRQTHFAAWGGRNPSDN